MPWCPWLVALVYYASFVGNKIAALPEQPILRIAKSRIFICIESRLLGRQVAWREGISPYSTFKRRFEITTSLFIE
jgi:hypothetical protein